MLKRILIVLIIGFGLIFVPYWVGSFVFKSNGVLYMYFMGLALVGLAFMIFALIGGIIYVAVNYIIGDD